MLWEIAFPGSVMILKLVFKIVIEQQLKAVDVTKALLAFPIDIAFLSFSFGAAMLYARPVGSIAVGTILTFAIALLAVTTVFAKKSDQSFTLSKFGMTFVHVIVAYVLSFVAFWCAVNAGAPI
jgi:hypothetical protein